MQRMDEVKTYLTTIPPKNGDEIIIMNNYAFIRANE